MTRISQDHKTKNQIDYITISSRLRGSLLDVTNCTDADSYSDRHLLVSLIRIILATAKQSRIPIERKYDLLNY